MPINGPTSPQPVTFQSECVERPSATEEIQVHPQALGSMFARRPLILGEDATAYDELMSKVMAAVRPVDAIEAMWVDDIVDLTWDTQRLRRLKASLHILAAKDV